MSAIRYAFDEALKSLTRGRRSAVTSVLTITVAFLTLGGFLVVLANLQAAATRWAEAAEVSVYLQDGLDEGGRAAIEQQLRSLPSVSEVVYVSKDEALRRFRGDFPQLAEVTGDLEMNPFPASLEVRLRPETATADAAQALAAVIAPRDGVADVQFDQRWLTRVLALVGAVRLLGLGIVAVLLTGAAFTVAAVIRLSLIARRDELDIMELVGAPFSYVRGPFVMEGLLQGLAGSLLAWALLRVGFSMAAGRVGEGTTDVIGADGLRFLGVGGTALLVLAGAAVGSLAGALASRPGREA